MRQKVRKLFVATVTFFGLILLVGAGAPLLRVESAQKQWRTVSGAVVSIDTHDSAQHYWTQFGVRESNGRVTEVQFCDRTSGAIVPVAATNLQYDVLKTAFMTGKLVQVETSVFENNKLCIAEVVVR
jgi:hypothetical protein